MRCASASSAADDGIRLAKELRPEVILLDIELGDLTGFEVLQQLKADPETRDIAVMLISAFSESIDRVRGLDLGAVDFITKPFEVIELTARVRSILRLQSAMHMLAVKAQIDGLTGLWNRKYFDARLESEFSESLRHGRPLSLIMTDIDKFKSLNDGYGHPFGDLVLERFARILSGGRTSDVACRYGGEEFGIVLPSTSLDEARDVAEQMRERLASERWPRHDDLRVTASFGVADVTCIARTCCPGRWSECPIGPCTRQSTADETVSRRRARCNRRCGSRRNESLQSQHGRRFVQTANELRPIGPTAGCRAWTRAALRSLTSVMHARGPHAAMRRIGFDAVDGFPSSC